MIRVQVRPHSLELQGHAEAGPHGQDLVCAAVSILAETLRAVLPEGAGDLGPGYARFRCSAQDPEVRFMVRGLKLLEEQYPQCVQVRWEESDR